MTEIFGLRDLTLLTALARVSQTLNYTMPPKRARFNLLSLGQNLTDLQNSLSVRKSMT